VRPIRLDAALLHAWTADVNRSKRAYYAEQTASERYERQVAASKKSLRYRRRKATK
jgi:hypothetical protein